VKIAATRNVSQILILNNAFVAGALPRIPLGELTMLSQARPLVSWAGTHPSHSSTL